MQRTANNEQIGPVQRRGCRRKPRLKTMSPRDFTGDQWEGLIDKDRPNVHQRAAERVLGPVRTNQVG